MARRPFNPQDHYFKKAKQEGFVARSAYKLQEIQKRFRLIKQGDKVLDLGCAPGAWSQVVSQLVGGAGFVEGIDLTPVTLNLKNAKFHVKDVFELKPEDLSFPIFDVLLSDMAPNTSGIPFQDQARSEALCLKVIELCPLLLKPGGNLVMKLFMGSGAKEIQESVRKKFHQHKQLRPDSTRKSSKEIFVVGMGYKGSQ